MDAQFFRKDSGKWTVCAQEDIGAVQISVIQIAKTDRI